jgi:type II secretory pathway component PulF
MRLAWNWRAVGAGTRIRPVHRIEFFRQMEMLVSSGVLIPDGLGRLKDRFPDSRMRGILQDVHARVTEGRTTLSQALARFPGSFPHNVITVIEAGEEGGASMLAERFADLAGRIAYEESNRRQVQKACAYPLFVVLMALGLQVLLLGVVFPRLAALLASIGGTLPPLTRALIAASGFVEHRWPLLGMALVAAPAGVLWMRRLPAAGLRLDELFLRLPVIGPIYRYLAIALVCRIYRSLYEANKPAPEIIHSCLELVGNRAFQRRLAEAGRKISTEGATLTSALSQSGLFPPLACLAFDVGEQSGRIADAMDRVSSYFGERARDRIAAAIAVINPAMTLVVVGGLGIVLIAFFQAIYQVVYATR